MSFTFIRIYIFALIAQIVDTIGNDPNHVPSLSEIQDLKDADLLDIFKSASNPGNTRPPEPEFLPVPTPGHVFPVLRMQAPTASPINASPGTFLERNGDDRQESKSVEGSRGFNTPTDYSSFANTPFPSLAYVAGSNLRQLANTGANVFVSGAEQFGRSLGVDTGRLSTSLLNVGGAIFGKKR
uniref:Secreted salivary gland peptide n=1 Tax=Ascaris lumbricoides TaxID=6252 RepID=A0A0M3IEF4_ASCLU